MSLVLNFVCLCVSLHRSDIHTHIYFDISLTHVQFLKTHPNHKHYLAKPSNNQPKKQTVFFKLSPFNWSSVCYLESRRSQKHKCRLQTKTYSDKKAQMLQKAGVIIVICIVVYSHSGYLTPFSTSYHCNQYTHRSRLSQLK